MATYHRTQLLLERWQYGALKALAAREGISVSNMVRRILTRRLRPRSTRRRALKDLAGIGRDRQASGRDHDHWLYGADSRT